VYIFPASDFISVPGYNIGAFSNYMYVSWFSLNCCTGTKHYNATGTVAGVAVFIL